MNSIIEQMLAQHPSATQNDKRNSIKEVVQEIVLCGLARAGFFQKRCFLQMSIQKPIFPETRIRIPSISAKEMLFFWAKGWFSSTVRQICSSM